MSHESTNAQSLTVDFDRGEIGDPVEVDQGPGLDFAGPHLRDQALPASDESRSVRVFGEQLERFRQVYRRIEIFDRLRIRDFSRTSDECN